MVWCLYRNIYIGNNWWWTGHKRGERGEEGRRGGVRLCTYSTCMGKIYRQMSNMNDPGDFESFGFINLSSVLEPPERNSCPRS